MGKLAEIKQMTDSSVADFINSIPSEHKRNDCLTLLKMMEKTTRQKPKCGGVPSSVLET